LYKRKACGPKTSIHANQKIETSDIFKKQQVNDGWSIDTDAPLYKRYNIEIDPTFLNVDNVPQDTYELDEIYLHSSDIECLLAQQHTLLWNEDKYLKISPGQRNKPLSIIYDEHAEELSFPSIYLGQARTFKTSVKVTPFMMATSKTRRKGRRRVTPQHIFYMAMKILRLRIIEGFYVSFRCVGETEHITKRMIEDKEYLDPCIEKNFCFLKSMPNSVQYWQQRKQDVFAMIRQLGKPTMFLTLSASEVLWSIPLQITR
jgi:hypothetical protein